MNIFVLDTNPAKAAEYHNDKHVVKMILESTQMLMSSYHVTNSKAVNDDNMYRLTHKNHPCTKWTNESIDNWKWLYNLTFSLNKEWQKRFGHNKDHLSITKLKSIVSKYGEPKLAKIGLSDFALAMPDEYKSFDAVQSYRTYYIKDKQHLASWRNKKPFWYKKS
jgi:hypothetical protein